jgi:hypothetical protein
MLHFIFGAESTAVCGSAGGEDKHGEQVNLPECDRAHA